MNSEKLKELADEANKLSREEKWGAAVSKWDELIPLLIDGVAQAYGNRGKARLKSGEHADAVAADYEAALRYRGIALTQYQAESPDPALYPDIAPFPPSKRKWWVWGGGGGLIGTGGIGYFLDWGNKLIDFWNKVLSLFQ